MCILNFVFFFCELIILFILGFFFKCCIGRYCRKVVVGIVDFWKRVVIRSLCDVFLKF